MRVPLFLLVIVAALPNWAAANDNAVAATKEATQQSYVVILGSYRDFHEAHRHAKAISAASGAPFSMQDRIYDAKRGLILRDDHPDELYAGSYISRRYNTTRLPGSQEEVEYLSIERSDAYAGFRKGYYILVAGIYDAQKEAQATVKKFSPVVADAYAKKTQIYYGCMH